MTTIKQKTNNKDVERIAVAYLRKSTEEQSTFSIISQKEYCAREALARGLTLPEKNIFVDDGFSARTTNRPALVRMLAFCQQKQNNIVSVIVYKIDRLSRDTADYLGMRKVLGGRGITIISCTEPTDSSPAGEFIETILAAAARYDNMAKAERVKANIIQRIKAGLPHGKAVFGYLNRREGNKSLYVADPESFGKVKGAWLMMEKGIYSLADIADFLNTSNVRIKRGQRRLTVTKQFLSKMFLDKIYAGYAVSQKNNLEVKSNQFPAMVTEECYYRVRNILLGRSHNPTLYQKLRPEFPVRGYLLCLSCHRSMRAGMSRGRNKYYGYYWCEDHPTPCVSSDDIDEAMLKLLRSLTPDDLTRKLFIEDCKRKYNDKYLPFVKQQCTVEDDITALKELKHKIAEKNYNGIISDNFAKEELERVDDEIMTKQSILAESKLALKDVEITAAFMDAFLEDLGKVYLQEKNLELKRYFIGSIFPKKLVFRNENLEPLTLAPAFTLIKGLATHDVASSAEDRT